MDKKILEQLSNVNGISGQEKYATRLMKSMLEDVCEEFTYDNLGSLIGLQKGSSELKLMLTAHLDEVGFIVKAIDENGFIRIIPIGGWWGHVLPAQGVIITNSKQEEFYGVIGSKPPHGMSAEIKNKVMEVKELYIDLGVSSKEEVQDLGIKLGDMITPDTKFQVMNNPKFVMGKAMDNRAGASVIVEVMKKINDKKHTANVYAVGSVQEEVGCRGALTAANLINPDVSLAIDVTLSNDTPGVDKDEVALGSGIGLSIMDASQLVHKGLLDEVVAICDEFNIKYVFDTMPGGGTDTGVIQKTSDGVIAMTLSIPSRYIHSHRSMIHEDDYDNCVALICKFIEKFDDSMLKRMKDSKK